MASHVSTPKLKETLRNQEDPELEKEVNDELEAFHAANQNAKNKTQVTECGRINDETNEVVESSDGSEFVDATNVEVNLIQQRCI